MHYERKEINPGSSEEFASVYRKYFEDQGDAFAKEIKIIPVRDLGAPAAPEVIERINSLPPNPEV